MSGDLFNEKGEIDTQEFQRRMPEGYEVVLQPADARYVIYDSLGNRVRVLEKAAIYANPELIDDTASELREERH